MRPAAEALIVTPHARKYVRQLGKHWMHNLTVEEDGDVRRITFPSDARGARWAGDALVTLAARGDALMCRVDASESGQREALKGAVARHLDRFAFREGPLTYNWRDLPEGEN